MKLAVVEEEPGALPSPPTMLDMVAGWRGGGGRGSLRAWKGKAHLQIQVDIRCAGALSVPAGTIGPRRWSALASIVNGFAHYHSRLAFEVVLSLCKVTCQLLATGCKRHFQYKTHQLSTTSNRNA